MSTVQKLYSETTRMKSDLTKGQTWEAEKKKTSEGILMFFVDYMEIRVFCCLEQHNQITVSALNCWQNMIYDTLNPEYDKDPLLTAQASVVCTHSMHTQAFTKNNTNVQNRPAHHCSPARPIHQPQVVGRRHAYSLQVQQVRLHVWERRAKKLVAPPADWGLTLQLLTSFKAWVGKKWLFTSINAVRCVWLLKSNIAYYFNRLSPPVEEIYYHIPLFFNILSFFVFSALTTFLSSETVFGIFPTILY